MKNKEPLVSIIMGEFNCESTLKAAINSILTQSYKNWEFIICDDASTDGSYQILCDYKNKYKSKFFILKNEENKGLNYTLNRCIHSANGKYIARMDGDDISNANRLMLEVRALEKYPEYQIVSSNMNYFDDNGIWGQSNMKKFPECKDLVYGPVFCHAACMVRRSAYESVKGYSISKKLIRVEDWHLWIKMYAKGYRGFNLEMPLYNMRDDRNAYKRRNFKYRLNEVYVICQAIKLLKMPFINYLYCFRPICVGILPEKVYMFLHRQKMIKMENSKK